MDRGGQAVAPCREDDGGSGAAWCTLREHDEHDDAYKKPHDDDSATE